VVVRGLAEQALFVVVAVDKALVVDSMVAGKRVAVVDSPWQALPPVISSQPRQ